MRHCINCIYYNPLLLTCSNENVAKQKRQRDDWCIEHKPSQETNTMKDKIQVQHSVLLNGTWYVVEPKFEADGGIYFHNPVPQPVAAAPISAPAQREYQPSEVRIVELQYIKTSSPHYKREEFAFAYINKDDGKLIEYLDNLPEFPEPKLSDSRLAKVVLL